MTVSRRLLCNMGSACAIHCEIVAKLFSEISNILQAMTQLASWVANPRLVETYRNAYKVTEQKDTSKKIASMMVKIGSPLIRPR